MTVTREEPLAAGYFVYLSQEGCFEHVALICPDDVKNTRSMHQVAADEGIGSDPASPGTGAVGLRNDTHTLPFGAELLDQGLEKMGFPNSRYALH